MTQRGQNGEMSAANASPVDGLSRLALSCPRVSPDSPPAPAPVSAFITGAGKLEEAD
jgi:hypothetical protein